MQKFNQIIIAADIQRAAAELAAASHMSAQIFPPLAEPARAATVADIAQIERAAMLKNPREQLFILAFSELSAIVQNRLLKLLEEPPAKVYFAIVCASKNTLLATVKSRLIITRAERAAPAAPLELDLRSLSDSDIANFSSPLAAKELTAALLATARAQRIRLDAATLALFDCCYTLAASASSSLIAPALLLSIRRCCD